MAAATVDPVYLSNYLELPLATINTVLDLPTAELVNSVLLAVTVKAREHETLLAEKVEKEHADIELEGRIRNAESRAEGLKSTVDKALKDVEELRQQLKTEENTRSALETELQTLKSSSSSSTSEVESLKIRISSLEAANRETISIVEAKTTANDVLAQDLQKQHSKSLELGQQVTALQQSVQNATSAASSAKFREENLKQELELAKKNNDWFENELKTKSAEALKFRKEKGARISELQRENEELNSNLTAAKRTEQALRTRLEEVQKKAEDSFAKIQQLQESAATMQESFRQELESAHRLADLQSQQTETHRNRLKEVEANLDKAKEDAAQEVGAARQDRDTVHESLLAAKDQVAELEARIDQLEQEREVAVQPFPGSAPGTPRHGLNGSTMGRPGSPAFGTPGSARKPAMTLTQAAHELGIVRGQLNFERREKDRLQKRVDDIGQVLDVTEPEMEELRSEHARLEQEVVQMSKFVDITGTERDKAKKEARTALNKSNAAQTEAKVLRQQSRDLSVQIKVLLCELETRDRGSDGLSAAEKAQLERIARGEISEESLAGMTDTDRFISERLTVFRNVSELQEKNEELLRLTRTLGAQMESEEALAEKHQAAADHEEVLSLRTKVENYKDELKSMITRSESYIKERDMFRRMLQYRGQLPAQSDLGSVFGQSVDEDGNNGIMSSIEQSPGSKHNMDNGKLLRELQSHFDQYREEQSIDRRTLKEQAEKLANDKSVLQAEMAKIGSQLAHANERYDMLHANYTMLQNENRELQKRSQLLSESAAKQDLRTQQTAEDLIEAKGLVESMRNENSNLKAEKKLWKDIQDRLGKENESLMNERSRLNNLVATQQSLQNEREISESEEKRRYVSQIEKLESELSLTKRKLNEEVEDSKKAQLRKEYDSSQTQKRIDDLMASLSAAREELVAAKTTRDHLQARVDELVIELKSAEERVELLQPRPTPRPGTTSDDAAIGQESEAQDTITREQELAIEISELKRDLEFAKTDLQNTRGQVEQYRQISQQAEEDLQSLNETQDQYREETDRIIEEKDTKIRELQQRVEDISSELATTNDELTGLRNQQSEVARHFEEEKAALETEINRLKDEDERHATTAQFHQQDLRAQAEIATKAQQDYETELVKHAEAAKMLQNLRTEFNQLKSEAVTFKTEAESAKVTLSQSQSSWEERKDQFEKELAEVRTRRDEIGAQNKLLHQQLESVTSQISALQQSRATFADDGELEPSTNSGASDRTVEELRELVKYLRREKEIVDVQYDLSQQEAKRLKQQFDYSQSQLDEARLKLDQERRSQADGARSSMAHKDLMEKLNELNLFRESSITLRNEARQAQSQLAEKTQRVEELLGQIKPLETKINELENARETQEGEMRLLQEDRDRWQKRTQDIISKYDRIDPAEMEQLRENIATLQAEKDALVAEQEPLRTQAQSFEEDRVKWQQGRERLTEQAKNRNRDQNKTIADRTAERDAAIQEKDALQVQVSTLRQELETALQEKRDAEQRLETLKEEMEAVKSERDEAVTKARPTSSGQSKDPSQSPTSVEQLSAIQQELQTMKQSKEAIEKELQASRVELNAAKQELETVKAERDQALAKAAAVQSSQTAKAAGNAQDDAEEGQINENCSKALSDEERQALQARVDAAEAQVKELERKLAETEANLDANVKQKADKMKASLNKKLAESRETIRTEEQQKYEERLAQDKVIWMAENAAPSSTAPVATNSQVANSSAPPTPQKTNGDAEKPDGLPELSDAQARVLVSSHPTFRAIMTNNIKKRLEAEAQKLKEEYQAKISEAEQAATAAAQNLADAEKKGEESKVSAVAMETKKSSLKINMAENRFRGASAKLEVVETAAKETPEKPVGEVWEVARLAKPAIVAPAVKKDAVTATPSAPAAPIIQQKTEPAASSSSLPQPAAQPPSGPAATNGSSLPVNTSSVPVPTQPSANRNISGSGIPQPRGGSNAGGRGSGRGVRGVYSAPNGGRGRGFQGLNNSSGSRPGSAMGTNPTAQPFSPGSGQKRPREDSQGGHDGNGAKRGRGGGGGRGQSS